ncbi:hypothetical protein ACJMK2_040922 [Sinanodonta woodiana]|uniref:Uncharacterized protein n=1 Tax=Sinanodonta woodiana TaxID=1069815 RepID=A0ABD3W2I1_SINWO
MECSSVPVAAQSFRKKYKGFKRIAIHSKFKCRPSAEKIKEEKKKSVILVSKTQITPTHRRIDKKAKVIISTPRKVCHQLKLMSRKSLREKMLYKNGFNDGLSSNFNSEWDKMMYDANKCLLELVKTSITKKHYYNSVTKWIRRNFIRTRHSAILQQLDSIIIWLGGCKKNFVSSDNRLKT